MFRMQVTGYKIAKYQKAVFFLGGAGEASICISYINTYIYIYIIMLPPKIYLLDSKYVLDILFLTACVYCHFLWHYSRKTPFHWEWHEKLNNVHTTNLFEFGYCIVTLAGPCSSKLQSCVKWAQHCGQMQGLKHVIFMSLHLIDAQFRHRLWNNFSCLVSKIFLKGLLSGSYWMAEVGWWEEPCNLYLAHMFWEPCILNLESKGLQTFANGTGNLPIYIYVYYIYIYIHMISPSCLVIILTIIHSNRWSGNTHIYIYTHVSGWWFQPLWKIWVRQLGWLFPRYGEKKNVPNHQSGTYIFTHFS